MSKDPQDPANSKFRPRAVPSHTTWGHQVYNIKTWRGGYFDALSTNITLFVFKRYAGLRTKIDVDDSGQEYEYPNADERDTFINVTDDVVMDSLLGTLGVPVSDRVRDAYIDLDLKLLDLNLDMKITSYEVVTFVRAALRVLLICTAIQCRRY